jgi:hypothetical protein
MIWESIVTKIIGTLPETVVKYYEKKQELKHSIEIEKMRGKLEWEKMKTQRASESEGRDHEWELASIQNSGFKDEWVLFLLSYPLVGVFLPWTQEATLAGFQTLAQTPQWYQWLVMVIFCAVYGIRLWRRSPLAQGFDPLKLQRKTGDSA